MYLLAFVVFATQAAAFKTNNLMVTMGGDFMYQGAAKWYTNMDKLIKYVNQVRNCD